MFSAEDIPSLASTPRRSFISPTLTSSSPDSTSTSSKSLWARTLAKHRALRPHSWSGLLQKYKPTRVAPPPPPAGQKYSDKDLYTAVNKPVKAGRPESPVYSLAGEIKDLTS